MKIRGRRLTAALLALCVGLGLAACGSGGQEADENTQQLSGKIYVPKFVDLDMEFSYINGGCCDGENAYILADVSSEKEMTDPETGETYTAYTSESGIYRVDLETGKTTPLENYEPSYSFASYDEGWFNVDSISMGADGTLWVNERASVYSYELPENFDEETDSKYNYQTSTDVELLRQLDNTGSELQRVEITNLMDQVPELQWLRGVKMDADGSLYVAGSSDTGEKVAVLDQDLKVLFSMDADLWGELITLGDGTIGLRRRNADGVFVVTSIDKAAKGWGTDYPLPASADNVYSGSADYIFYYGSGESLYGYNAETGEGERLLSWSSADINVDRLQFFTFLADGRVAAMTQNWGWEGEGPSVELAVLEETDASVLADKTILTFATMGLGSDQRSAIIKFNKTSPNCRIEIRDYSEYATEEDYQAGLTKLNAEILSGNVPDIMDVNRLPIRQYGAKGLLEDLWPYIDKDPDISREGLMERVFTAAEQDGKLYRIFESFGISTVMGSRKVVGDDLGWTLADLQAALATMPEGCAIFGEGDTKDQMLSSVLSMNLDSYVDWDNGTSSFDSDAFKAALEFCNSFPMEFDWESYEYDDSNSEPARIAGGRQLLLSQVISSFGDIQMYEAMFAGEEGLKDYSIDYGMSSGGSMTTVVVGGSGSSSSDSYKSQRLIPGRYITYIGYPMEDGSCGSSFTVYGSSLAMSSTCKDKDAAWSFMREVLLPAEDRVYNPATFGRGTFATNKNDFEAAAAEAMTAEYMTDSEGKQILDNEGNPVQESKGGWGWGSLQIDLQATTQEEYDQLMELYNAIDSLYSYDTSIYDIIRDLAGGYFSGDRSLDETASQIQSRVNLYLNESR